MFLIGGGRSALYPPNEVVVWDDAPRKEVADLEFKAKYTCWHIGEGGLLWLYAERGCF
jgi:hypothetical protein